MSYRLVVILLLTLALNRGLADECPVDDNGISSCEKKEQAETIVTESKWDKMRKRVNTAISKYKDCESKKCYKNIIQKDFKPWKKEGITEDLFRQAKQKHSLIHYQIIGKKLYRSEKCNFPMRCEGIEHFILEVLRTRSLPDMEFIVNVNDYPQSHKYGPPLPIFSFSKDTNYNDIMYPAWAFWKGGPCTTTEKNCLGRWDLKRKLMTEKKHSPPWEKKKKIVFFRGSRTSQERDPLIKLSLQHPDLIEARYTKNQAWRSLADSMGMEPSPEVHLHEHCQYRYLFNFRGVAASFRHRHLFLCKSLIFHVGNEWIEFYYPSMKPWVHYIPIKTDFSDAWENIQFALENEDLSQKIGENGYNFIWNHLKLEDVSNYWYSILQQYARLAKWKVTKSPDTSLVVEAKD